MVQFVAMAKVLVLFIYLLMALFFEASCRLEYFYAQLIKAEYALLFGLNIFTRYRCYTLKLSVIRYE